MRLLKLSVLLAAAMVPACSIETTEADDSLFHEARGVDEEFFNQYRGISANGTTGCYKQQVFVPGNITIYAWDGAGTSGDPYMSLFAPGGGHIMTTATAGFTDFVYGTWPTSGVWQV